MIETGLRERVLVSGASGFIGSHLCEELVRRGYEVHALSRSARPERPGPVRWWQLDLSDPAETLSTFSRIKPDIFFHLASHVVGARDLAAVYPTFRDNALSTVSALSALAKTGCQRCVLADSLETPNMSAGDTTPSSPYAAAKATSTLYGNMYAELFGLPITNARIFMVYGPRQNDVKKVVPYSIRCFARGSAPKFGSLRPVDWIYVSDVVDGLIAAATSEASLGKTVDLGSGELVRVRDVIRRIGALMDVKREIVFEPLNERPLEQVRKADVALSRSLIGWEPKTTMSAGLRNAINYFQQPADA